MEYVISEDTAFSVFIAVCVKETRQGKKEI